LKTRYGLNFEQTAKLLANGDSHFGNSDASCNAKLLAGQRIKGLSRFCLGQCRRVMQFLIVCWSNWSENCKKLTYRISVPVYPQSAQLYSVCPLWSGRIAVTVGYKCHRLTTVTSDVARTCDADEFLISISALLWVDWGMPLLPTPSEWRRSNGIVVDVVVDS